MYFYKEVSSHQLVSNSGLARLEFLFDPPEAPDWDRKLGEVTQSHSIIMLFVSNVYIYNSKMIRLVAPFTLQGTQKEAI